VCTLSWTTRPGGYWLLFNRDERRTRAPARPPELAALHGVSYLAPTDGDFGGTWIGVNHWGLTVALLNRYEDAPVDPSGGAVSRGLLLRSLLDAPSAVALVARLESGAGDGLRDYRAFTVVTTDRGGSIQLADWNGQTLEASRGAPGMVRTSSGRDQRAAERVRSEVLANIVGAKGEITIERLREFHASHLPERGPFSVCMHREEAETQSFTEIDVWHDEAVLRYVAGPPGEGGPVTRVALPLVRAR